MVVLLVCVMMQVPGNEVARTRRRVAGQEPRPRDVRLSGSSRPGLGTCRGDEFRESFCGRLRFELVTVGPVPLHRWSVRSPDACRRALTRSSGSGARRSTGAPVSGCSNASRCACRNCRHRPCRPRVPVVRDRRPRDVRSPTDARGSGACARSRASPAAACRRASVCSVSKWVIAWCGSSVSVEIFVRDPAVAAERRVDRAAPGGRAALDQRDVLAGDLARAQRGLQGGMRRLVAGEHEQARTCRGRAGARRRGGRGRARPPRGPPAPARASPRGCPAPGWTTTPAGLSTTIRCSSS